MGVEQPIVDVLVFGIGFAAGFGVRAWISARRSQEVGRLAFPISNSCAGRYNWRGLVVTIIR